MSIFQSTNTKRWLQLLAALIAGLCYPLAFAPWHLVALLLVSLALLWWLLHDQDRRASWQLGYAFGLGQFGMGVPWVYVSMHQFGGTNAALSGLMTGLFVMLLALFPALAAWLGRRLSGKAYSPLAFVASWMLIDWLRGWVLCGFPWIYAGYAAIDSPLAKLAAYGGVWLVTLGLLFTALTFASLLTRRWHWPVPTLALLFWLAAWFLPASPGVTPVGAREPVALVQANIKQSVKWQLSQQQQTRRVYADLTASISDKHRLVIWSESALTEFYSDAQQWLEHQAAPFAKAGGALIAGLPRYRLDSDYRPVFYNSLLVVAGGSGIYNKQKLVPFGEYVPLGNLIRGLVPFFDLPMSSFTAGGADQPNLDAQGQLIAPLVCYDALFPGLVANQAKGSHVLLEVSDDAWFGTSAGPWQHFQMARMRSVETGRYLLRDTNNGVTAIIDPTGRIVSALPQFTRGVLTGSYQPMSGNTPFMTWGRWLAPIMTLLLFLTCLPTLRKRFTKRDSDHQREAP